MSSKEYIDRLKKILASNPKTPTTNNSFDQIFENCYLGDKDTALNKEKLKRLEVQYVLNAAQGSGDGQVNTNNEFYKNDGINFLGLGLKDDKNEKVIDMLKKAAAFLDDGLSNNS